MPHLPTPPTLLSLIYGERARVLQHSAPARLLRWSQAFDDWLADVRRRNRRSSNSNLSLSAWRLLHRLHPRPPYEVDPAGILAYGSWLKELDYAASTVNIFVWRLASFYRWCDERRIDPATPPGFNPAAGWRRLAGTPYAAGPLLSRAQVDVLLGLMRRDETPLGRRDYAFFLARLHMGVHPDVLQELRWGQLRPGPDGVELLCPGPPGPSGPPDAPPLPVPLPPAAWAAIRAWLESSGRLAGIRPDDYVFTPLRCMARLDPQDQPETWAADRPLSIYVVRNSLRVYGRAAGLPERVLLTRVLRPTALRLWLDAGGRDAPPAELLRFLGPPGDLAAALRRVRNLPPLPEA